MSCSVPMPSMKQAMPRTGSISPRGTLRESLLRGAALTELGNLAMSGSNTHEIMRTAAALVVETLKLDSCEIMEILPGEESLVLAAVAGLPDAGVGQVRVANTAESQAGFTLGQGKAVISNDLRKEVRFKPCQFLLNHGLVSGVTVPITWNLGTFGVLGAHSRRRRSVRQDEVIFLRAVARSLAGSAEHRRKENCLTSSKARLQGILDTAVDGIITINEDGLIESFNVAAQELFGYEATEVLGRNVAMLMPLPFRDEHDGYIQAYLTTGIKRIIGSGREVTGRRRDGTVFPADLAISEVNLGERRIFTGIIRDATARQQTELELRRLNELKSEFVALVSHELRAPLTNLSGGLETISQDVCELPPPTRRTVKLLSQEVGRLARLVESILDVSRLEAGGLPFNLGLVWLEPVLARVVSGMAWASGDCTIETRLDDRLPPVWADEVYVEQALRNLLENALRYSDPNATVVIAGKADATQVEISITDSGPGISPDEQGRIFDAFYRSAKAKSDSLGYGLGLYFARKFIEAQGGSLEVLSPAQDTVTNPGTTFIISLPVAVDD